MTSRRELLRAAAAAPALPLVASPFVRALAAEGLGTLTLERFVFDVRFAEAGAIAEHVSRLGVPVTPVADDLMSLWYDERCRARWSEVRAHVRAVPRRRAGFVRRGTWSMPPFRPTEVTERDIQDIAAYLRRSSGAAGGR